MDNASIHSAFVIGSDKKIKFTMTYPMSAGRNFDEMLRAFDAIKLNAKHTVATPVNWRPGEDVIIPTSVSDEAIRGTRTGWKTLKLYLRVGSKPK